jgi:hypothetical protein
MTCDDFLAPTGFVDRGVMIERDNVNDPYSSDVDIFNNILSARRDSTPGSSRNQWFIGLHVDPAKLSNPATLSIGINYIMCFGIPIRIRNNSIPPQERGICAGKLAAEWFRQPELQIR